MAPLTHKVFVRFTFSKHSSDKAFQDLKTLIQCTRPHPKVFSYLRLPMYCTHSAITFCHLTDIILVMMVMDKPCGVHRSNLIPAYCQLQCNAVQSTRSLIKTSSSAENDDKSGTTSLQNCSPAGNKLTSSQQQEKRVESSLDKSAWSNEDGPLSLSGIRSNEVYLKFLCLTSNKLRASRLTNTRELVCQNCASS